ncbi:hypothetical protein G4G27_05165 [Sphingomonas sp. So64.6b]|uniref:Rossmann fold domain-containing protein n=1 Tax=Sphingomonas sp. So64.6b TaxID=2997354 RepID=UPI0016037B80|nr:hypothetical protein [Sphingomonas sp. So64.6b]QNA83460.1 hypothetical protein G4G27_05165 [Sphingomonas sp. So64.6b]
MTAGPATGDLLSAVVTLLGGISDSVRILPATVPIGDMIDQLRGARPEMTPEMTLVLAGPDLTAIDRAMLLAAMGPLAIELAPARRIGVLDIADGAAAAEIAAAARFLIEAGSTTGQTLRIEAVS